MTATATRPDIPEPHGRARPTAGTDAGGHLPHFPALEGLRGLAVAGVVLFHAQFGWMQGGFLGVSTFFTLSGFLITSLLLTERHRTGGVDLRRFWTRRVRRLMPASFAALALIVVFGVLAADAAQQRRLAGDVTAALAYVANWRFLFSHQSYGELFSAPSPVLHFWSLAIEEQFYLVFPLVAWFGLARLRLRNGTVAAVLAVLIAAALALTLVGGLSHDAIYYSTFTRSAELLTGALLAALVCRPARKATNGAGFALRSGAARARRRAPDASTECSTDASTECSTDGSTEGWSDGAVVRTAAGPVATVAGAAALVAMVGLWALVPQDADWLYRGGFVAYAALSALVIVAATAAHGPVRRLLASRPLCALGAISYGVYLFHWPVFVWLDPSRTGWSDTALFVPRIGITLVLAVLSFRFLETPIRRGARVGPVRPAILVPVVAVGLAVGAIAVTLSVPAPTIDFEAAEAQLASGGADAPKASGPVAAAAQAPFPRMAIFGDSTAVMTGKGLAQFGASSAEADVVPGRAQLGCGVGRGGERTNVGWDGKVVSGPVPDVCNAWEQTWYDAIRANEPTIAVVQVGPWETADRLLPGDTTWRSLGDPVYDHYLEGELDAAVRTLAKDGALVVWLTSPILGTDSQGRDAVTARGPGGEPARMARLNELIRALPARNPGLVQVVDLAGWIASTGTEDRRLRPDGVHFDEATSAEVADRYLGDAIVRAYRDGWPARIATRAYAPAAAPTPTPTPTAPPTPPR